MHAPPVWISFNEIVLVLGCFEFSVYFNLLFEFHIFDMLVFSMYTHKFIIIAGSCEQFMMCCENIFTSEDGMKDKGGWKP